MCRTPTAVSDMFVTTQSWTVYALKDITPSLTQEQIGHSQQAVCPYGQSRAGHILVPWPRL